MSDRNLVEEQPERKLKKSRICTEKRINIWRCDCHAPCQLKVVQSKRFIYCSSDRDFRRYPHYRSRGGKLQIPKGFSALTFAIVGSGIG